MGTTFDLTESFVSLITLQDEQHPEFRLEQNLGKVNVVLTDFAESLGLERDELSVLHVCADSEHLHPALLKYINSLPRDGAYKGQNVSRIKNLVRHLPWLSRQNDGEPDHPSLLDEHLPSHLEEIWFLLPRVRPGDRYAHAEPDKYASNGGKQSVPLSANGVSVGLALLRVSKAHRISDVRTLVEDYSAHIYKALCGNNPCHRWISIRAAFNNFRVKVREFLNYKVEKPPEVTIKPENLPEPLCSQVLLYKERAENGFKSGHSIKRMGLKKYGLKLNRQEQVTIDTTVNIICRGLGYVPRDLYGDSLDIKDLMNLDVREIEVDGTKVSEVYNVLIDPYRERELDRESDYKEADYDSESFGLFVRAVATVAAYNGLFHLRKTFLQVYSVNLDANTTKNRKRDMKRTFDREWVDRQLENLKSKFYRILDEETYGSKPDGRMIKEARDNLNLCLFYVVLLTFRRLGPRQRNIRESREDVNVIVISRNRVTFQWLENETKNKKGIIHRLDSEKHGETHADLIKAMWAYRRHLYPVISGARGDKDSAELMKRRRQAIGGRFYVKIRRDGICVPFGSEREFYCWFRRQSYKFLDFEGMLDGNTKIPSPHFYRGLFGDWTHTDLECPSGESAALAADTEKTFVEFYLEPTTLFDATDTWTKINQKLKERRRGESGIEHGKRAEHGRRTA